MPAGQSIEGLPLGWEGRSFPVRFMAFSAWAEQVFPGGVKVRVSITGARNRRDACREILALVTAAEAYHELLKRDAPVPLPEPDDGAVAGAMRAALRETVE